MNDIAIQVENLGKLYRVGQLQPYKTLRETLMNAVSAPARAVASAIQRQRSEARETRSDNTIWALKNASFEVKQGEAVGVIGRNGAGKTTLLKILTRITMPTEGYAMIRGRVGSLLEIGTGLHPELTGRENIYLMGSISGMRRAEIDRKFAEIVDFADIEKFLDTPLKRYSYGMQMRLGFSVAAHLEPEILLVDEVLAVGDVAFQKKCLGKMGDVARGGRTVLFVSHNMGAIENLCGRCILLEQGEIRNIGRTGDIINEYLTISLEISSVPLSERKTDYTNPRFIFTDIEFRNSKGEKLSSLSSGEDTSIALDYVCQDSQRLKDVKIRYDIRRMGEAFVALDTEFYQSFAEIPTQGRIICNIPKLPLMPGHYSVDISAYSRRIQTNQLRDAAAFYVKEGPFFSSGLLPRDSEARTLVDHSWILEEKED